MGCAGADAPHVNNAPSSKQQTKDPLRNGVPAFLIAYFTSSFSSPIPQLCWA